MTFPAVPPLVSRKTFEHSLIRGFLQVHIERCVNLKATFVNLIGAVLALKISADFFHEIRSEGVGTVSEMQDQRRGSCGVRLRGSDLSVLQHGIDHQVATLLGTIRM